MSFCTAFCTDPFFLWIEFLFTCLWFVKPLFRQLNLQDNKHVAETLLLFFSLDRAANLNNNEKKASYLSSLSCHLAFSANFILSKLRHVKKAARYHQVWQIPTHTLRRVSVEAGPVALASSHTCSVGRKCLISGPVIPLICIWHPYKCETIVFKVAWKMHREQLY